jgi:hypothetical protein
MGIDVAAELISGVAATEQESTMLSDRQVEQESGTKRDIGDPEVIPGLSRHKSSLTLEQQVTSRKESYPKSSPTRTLIKAKTLLPIAGLSEGPDLDAGLRRRRRYD